MNRGLLESVVLVVLVILGAAAALYPLILRLNRDLLRASADLAHANMGLLAALGSAVAKRDRGTNSHNYRVTIYAIRLGEAVGLSPERIRGLIKGAFLHDVGKLAITDAILQKPGRLTDEESAVMRAHVRHGVEIVAKFRWLQDALDVVQHHHEKIDGTGYPAGLQGDAIPIAARIFAIVDVFDALTTRRPYKEPAPLHESVFALLAGKGSAFDPALVDTFLCLAPELHRTLCGAAEPVLVRTLDRLLGDYFTAEEDHVRRGVHALRDAALLEEDALEYLSGAWSLDPAAGRPPPGRPADARRAAH
jgi:putative nucleotidyltransferase with HDIG domain